jgi:hypothetical protein
MNRNTNRNLRVLAAAFALLVTATASAQTTQIRTNVPFNFIVNGSPLPAGEYSFEPLYSGGKVLLIRSVNSGTGNMVAVNEERSSDPSSPTKLVFHRYGDQYFLAEIRIAGDNIVRQVPRSRREKQAAMNSSTQGVVLSAASH